LVTLRDPLRREALTCFIKELVRQPLQRQEIKPEEACEAIWCAAAYAMKATPTEVAKVLLTVSKATLKKKMKVPKGFYPVNMPLVLACIIDRIMITEKQQGGSRFEKTFSQHLLKILFSRWTLGSVHGSQFLANLILTWDSLGWFQEKHLEPCKKALMLLVAYAGKEGVPDPPDKNDGHGWYRVVARDTDEAAGSEPLCSEVVLQELRTLSEPDEKTPTATEVRRDRVNHAMAQMGLGTEDHPAEVPTASEPTNSEAALFGSPVKGPSAEPQPETLNDKELEELFEPSEAGDAPEDPANDIGDEEQETIPTASVPSSYLDPEPAYDPLAAEVPSASISEAGLFGSPTKAAEDAALQQEQAKETLAYDAFASQATQPYESQASQQATQAYQDEPPSKRPRVDAASQGPA